MGSLSDVSKYKDTVIYEAYDADYTIKSMLILITVMCQGELSKAFFI